MGKNCEDLSNQAEKILNGKEGEFDEDEVFQVKSITKEGIVEALQILILQNRVIIREQKKTNGTVKWHTKAIFMLFGMFSSIFVSMVIFFFTRLVA